MASKHTITQFKQRGEPQQCSLKIERKFTQQRNVQIAVRTATGRSPCPRRTLPQRHRRGRSRRNRPCQRPPASRSIGSSTQITHTSTNTNTKYACDTGMIHSGAPQWRGTHTSPGAINQSFVSPYCIQKRCNGATHRVLPLGRRPLARRSTRHGAPRSKPMHVRVHRSAVSPTP